MILGSGRGGASGVICGDRGCGDALYVKGGRQETAQLTIIGCAGAIALPSAPSCYIYSCSELTVATCSILIFLFRCSRCGSRRAAHSEGVRWVVQKDHHSLTLHFPQPDVLGSPDSSPYIRSPRQILQRFPGSTMEFLQKRQARDGHLGRIDGFYRAV